MKKSENPVLIAQKERHDRLLTEFKEGKNYLGVEILPSKLSHISVRGNKAGCSDLFSKQVSVGIAAGQSLNMTKSALVNNFASQINYKARKLESDEQKISYLNDILKTPPAFVACKDVKVRKRIRRYYKSNPRSFNFKNPSNVDAVWKEELQERELESVDTEFTYERKNAIFRAIVNDIINKLS